MRHSPCHDGFISNTTFFHLPPKVFEDGTTTILFDFDVEKSVLFNNTGKNGEVKVIVKPVVKLTVTPAEPALSLQINSPEDGEEVPESPLPITGVVSDPEATVEINGDAVDVDEDGVLSGEVELEEGKNTITIVATLGDETIDETIIVTYEPSA